MGTRVTFTPDLLEREHELGALSTAVGRARDGAGAAVLIQGPAGVGKSRLLARARAEAAGGGTQVLEARGASLEREFAFGVARQLFEAVWRDATSQSVGGCSAGRPGFRSACSARRGRSSWRRAGTPRSARCTASTG